MPTPSFLVFGVNGQGPVAAAIAALNLRFVGEPEVVTTPSLPLMDDLYADDEDEDVYMDEGDDAWDLVEGQDLEDAPVAVAGVRTARTSAFSQMVGGAVAGGRTTRPVARLRTREDNANAFTQMVVGAQRPVQPATQQPGPHFFSAEPVVDTTTILANLAEGKPLAPAHAALQTRLNAAAEGCLLLTGQKPAGQTAVLTLHTMEDGQPALFIGLEAGAPWASLNLPNGVDGNGHIGPYLGAVFPEWGGAQLMQMG